MTRCEDYPCCGHTDGLGCNWTPESVYNDPHLYCNHDAGCCEVEDYAECDGDPEYCPEGGCPNCDEGKHAEEFGYVMEDQWLDGSYEE